jgi:esterase FrsA
MAFIFPVDVHELIGERATQWIGIGVPEPVIAHCQTRVVDMWLDGPGGWAHEWSTAASDAEQAGDLLQASLLYGIAKFPVLAGEPHRKAYDNQLRTYLQASDGFDVGFQRHLVDVRFRDSVAQVPTHVFQPAGLPNDAPLVLLLSGVDTWKMDIHRMSVGTAQALGGRVSTVDMAGTGESAVPNGTDGELYLAGVLDWLRTRFPTSRKTGAVGFSFGGHWTTKLALTGRVDAAVSVGGLVDAGFGAPSVSKLRFAMKDIFANSLHLDTAPTTDEVIAAMAPFSLRVQGLLDDWGADPVPFLTVNGDRDPHVPSSDVTLFADRPNTIARLVPGATHCAAEALGEVIPWMLQWLGAQLS